MPGCVMEGCERPAAREYPFRCDGETYRAEVKLPLCMGCCFEMLAVEQRPDLKMRYEIELLAGLALNAELRDTPPRFVSERRQFVVRRLPLVPGQPLPSNLPRL